MVKEIFREDESEYLWILFQHAIIGRASEWYALEEVYDQSTLLEASGEYGQSLPTSHIHATNADIPPDLLKLMAITHFFDLYFFMNLVNHPKPLEGEEPDRSAEQMQKDWCKTLDKVFKDQSKAVKRSVRATLSSMEDKVDWFLPESTWEEVSLAELYNLATRLTAVAALHRLQRTRRSYGTTAGRFLPSFDDALPCLTILESRLPSTLR